MAGMLFYGLLFPSLGIHLFADRTNPGSSSPTLIQNPLVCGYFYLHLTHLCSIFVTPLSSDPLLSPIAPLWFPVNPLIHHDSESSYSFYFYLPPMSIIGYGPCTRPALIMYVYNVWCLLLAFPRLEIDLSHSTACPLYSNLRVVLVDYSNHLISISCSCACLWYLGENWCIGFRSLILPLHTRCLRHLGENWSGTKES